MASDTKKLLNTLYVLSEDAYLTLDGENVVVNKAGKEAGRFPLHTLQSIEHFGYKGASPRLMGECSARGIDLAFFTPSGRFLTRVAGLPTGNVLLRHQQFAIAADKAAANAISRNIIVGKIFNSRWVLERAVRDHPTQVDVDAIKARSGELAELLASARSADTAEELRGIEGAAARSYYSAFGGLILSPDESLRFTGRTRRPPKDPVNAMLSFAYTLLASDCGSALNGVGLDPYMGFMHVLRPGRKSLALDLMEEFRSVFADRVVLTCINNRMIGGGSFRRREGGSVLLNDSARRKFLEAWQKRKREKITHPYLGEKLEWGMVPHVQALLLARHIRGDIDGYPPFMWK